MSALPESPEELLKELCAIFPQFQDSYESAIDDGAPTYHSVLIVFTSFFGANLPSFSAAQLSSFGALISEAVAKDGPLENAFGTCLLEHLHQIKAARALRPYLSKSAREKTHA